MAALELDGFKVRGLCCAVPSNAVDSSSSLFNFNQDEIDSVCSLIGVKTRRLAQDSTCSSDLCAAAAESLLENLNWDPKSVGLLVFVSQTPDYFMPATSTILQDKLGLSSQAAVFDVNLACSGYVYGLWIAASIMRSGAAGRALLLVGDTISKMVSPDDRSTALLFGDAGSATALELDDNAGKAVFVMGTDGSGAQNLITPNGAFRNYHCANSDDYKQSIYMDGCAIFNFAIETVPPLVRNVLNASDSKCEDIDYFIFHQASEFVLKHIAKMLKLPLDKVPMSIQQYGNTSSASIPLTAAAQLSDKLLSDNLRIVMAGFGAGYSWGAVEMGIGPLDYVGLVEV